MSDDKQAHKEMLVKYKADSIIYHLTVLERLAKGTQYEAAAKQILKLVQDMK